MVLPPTCRGNGVVGHTGVVDIRRPPTEHSRTIYCNTDNYGPVSGGGVSPRVKGVEAVMVSGGPGSMGETDGGSYGRIGNRGEGGRVDGGRDQ